MTKKRKRRKANGNGLDPDEQLTPEQACKYAAESDVHINTNGLALLRRDGRGPKYLKINGRWIRYTRRFLDPFVKARRPRLVIPASRRRN